MKVWSSAAQASRSAQRHQVWSLPESRPAHELKGFERVDLAPGQTRHITIPLPARAFAWYNAQAHRWVVDPGTFSIAVGQTLADLPLAGTLEVTEASLRGADLSR